MKKTWEILATLSLLPIRWFKGIRQSLYSSPFKTVRKETQSLLQGLRTSSYWTVKYCKSIEQLMNMEPVMDIHPSFWILDAN